MEKLSVKTAIIICIGGAKIARGRMIDKRVSNSKKIGKVSDKAKVLWFMIYPHLDREGRIAFDDIEDFKDEILPKFKSWSLKKIADGLNELADVKLINLYPNENRIAMEFFKFEDFQIGLRKEREAKSKVIPMDEIKGRSGVFRITPALRLNKVKVKEGRKEGIFFDFDKQLFFNIQEEDKDRWRKTYPACDIERELLFIADWLIGNPEKKKINYKAFISRWLKKTQDQGGTKGVKKKGPSAWAVEKMKEEKNAKD